MPLLRDSLSLSYGEVSWLLVGGYIASIIFTVLLIPASRKYSERVLTFFVSAIAVAAIFASYFVGGMASLIFMAVLLGCAVSGLGAMSNILVISGTPESSRGRMMCGLHAMYGVGSFLAPASVGLIVSAGLNWRFGLWAALPVLLSVLVFGASKIPDTTEPELEPGMKRSLQPVHYLVLTCFGLYVGGEVVFSMWLVTFLVETKGLSVAAAAPYATGFFAMMAGTRLLCFFGLREFQEKILMVSSLVLSLSFIVLGHWGWLWAFPLAGVLGPYFPILLARVSRAFPREIKPLTIWILTTMQITLGLCHALVGRLADRIGIQQTYLLPILLLTLAILGALLFFRWERIHRGPDLILSE